MSDLEYHNTESWITQGVSTNSIHGKTVTGLCESEDAGLRILAMVKSVLGKENPTSGIDTKKIPGKTCFTFSDDEFDVVQLYHDTFNAGNIITLHILEKCKWESLEDEGADFIFI